VIELEVRLTPRDMRLVRLGAGGRRWRSLATMVPFLVLVAITSHSLAVLIVSTAIGVVAYIALTRLLVRRAFRSNPLLRGTQHWTIGEEGLACESTRDDGERAGEARYEWRAIDRVVDARDAVLLFTSARVCMVLPKRCFASDAEIQQLRALVAARGLLRS
jgi:YcxB-like protein